MATIRIGSTAITGISIGPITAITRIITDNIGCIITRTMGTRIGISTVSTRIITEPDEIG